MSTPTVSVIIPTHNRAGLLGRAIASVLAQTHDDWELLVVDDASTDDTEAVVRRVADPRVRYLRQPERRGAPAARNRGIREARGQYLAHLDSDDEWAPQKLERQLAVFRSSGPAPLGAVMCGVRTVHPDGRTQDDIPSARGWLYEPLLARRVSRVATSQLMVRHDSAAPVLFDEALPAFQDWDYLLALAQRWQVDFIPQVLVLMHRHSGEHIFRPANIARAWEVLLSKHAAELRRRPRVHAHHHVRAAMAWHTLGRRRATVRHLASAIRAYPQGLRCYAWLAGALLGPYGFRASLKLIPYQAPAAW